MLDALFPLWHLGFRRAMKPLHIERSSYASLQSYIPRHPRPLRHAFRMPGAIADRLGVREGPSNVTVKEAMDEGYRIATA